MTDFAKRIAALTPRQRELLERRLHREGMASRAPAGIRRLPDTGAYELSFGQQRLWFIDQLYPGSPAYNIPFAGRLEGPLDLGVLQRAVDEIVRRHEILRTTFGMENGRPVQKVAPPLSLPIRFDDLKDVPEQIREGEAERRMDQEARIPFDLTRGPVLRIRVLRLDPASHVLLVTMPHIVTDAWSMAVFFRELPALYEAFTAGKPSPLPELPIQFRDYAAWQRTSVDDARLHELVSFWKRELAGASTLLELPGDFQRPAVHRFSGRRYEMNIPGELTRAVRDLSQREGVTMFMMMLAAFAILLERYSGQKDILIGSPVATRDRVESEGLIGFFINTVVFRAQLEGVLTFRQLLASVRERTLAAFAHQDLPFEKLVEALGLERTLTHQPLSQVTLVLQNVHIPPPRFEKLRLKHFQQTDSRTAKVDLMLGLWESDQDLRGWLEYNTDLFRAETIERMARQFVALLRSIVQEPGRRVDELSLMDEDERREVLFDWNATERPYPREKTLGELFREQVESRGDAIALELGEQRLSYRKLGERASAVAATLRGMGVGPEVRVGIALGRSVELIVAMVGVIEAGGAYVPLDPGYPAERLRYMIEDSGVEVILTDHAGAKRLPATAARLLLIEESSPHPAFGHPLPQAGEGADCSDRAFSRLREKVPEGRMRAESLAYVIYTSGSTGRPKGVMVEHRPIVRLTKNNPFVQLGPDAVMLQYAPATFDAATFEIWDPLLNGARLVLAPPGTLSLEELGAVIRSSGVNTLALTTGLFHAMVDERLEDLHGLREFLAGGDALSGEHVKRLLGTIPTVVAINGYGPTEATTLAACYRIESAGQVAHDVPIGRAIANTTMYVLDERLQPVPVNLTGELYIGGDALARGYAGGPALTAERFVPNPFRPGERLYRTGDVGRWNSRGELEFLGRFDEQLKVRGFRVEPGEIEAALREHEAVGNAAVIGRKEGIAATTILVAFVTPRPEADSPEPTLLRDFLRGRLPEHIVPAQIAVLDQLPLTPNGKVDRKALRTLGVASPQPAGEKAAPQTNDEETLLRIWSEVLKVDRIGVHDNFFELGGDSILGLLVVSRARDAGLILVPAALFEHPTIAGLAAFAVTRGATAPGEKQSDVGPLPVSPIVQWFFESIDCDVHHWNLAFPLRCRKQLDPGVVEKALHAVVKHHGGLRLRAERDQSGRWRLWVSSPEEQQPLRLHRIDLRAVPPESREMVRMSELNIVHASLDLLAGPVVRAVWIERDDELPELVLIGHHLAVDAVSWRTIGEDLELACAAIERGHEPALPAPGTSLRAWSSLLNETSTFDDQLEMWVEVCRRPAARLPRDREGEEREEFRRTLRRDVPPDRTDQLLRDAVKAYRMRVDEIILAAFASVMVRWTGEGAIRVDVEGYGREASRFPGVDLSRTVGWLTTIAPLYLELSTDHIGEILKHVKEQARAVPDRGLGFGILRYLREEGRRELSRYPRSEVSFNYLGSVDTLRDVSERFMLGRLDVGLMRSPRGRMPYLLSLDAVIVEGALQLHLTGNTAIHELETLESLADSILAELHRLVDHCLALETGEFTPSDFPEAELDAAQLQKLLAQLGAGEGDPA